MSQFYAHSGDDPDYRDWQLLRDHLTQVAEQARRMAAEAVPHDHALAETAYAAGLLHDLGKYRLEFQQMIRGLSPQKERTYHKQAGAAKAADGNNIPAAFAVAGHHGGLPDMADLGSSVKGDNGRAVVDAVWKDAIVDCPELGSLSVVQPHLEDKLHADLFTRLVFSYLVDADWSDTGAHARQVKGLPPEPTPPALDAPGWRDRVLAFIQTKAASCKDAHIATVRSEVLQACLTRADDSPGLFSLTVPTGGGKTLSGLAFALKHAAKHGLRRVIYVAPYLSILDQNVKVIREALGFAKDAAELFEHHSLAEPPGDGNQNDTERADAARRAENWDSPVIVTTNVQFFESLFANKPGRCRKLHNIARSVIILDECQTLPPDLFAPTCAMLKQVAERLGSTIVLCTATQPAFDHPDLKDDERLPAVEIIPESLDLFNRLKRVELFWPAGKDDVLEWPQVAERMLTEARSERPAALCVVNTRRAAREVFMELKRKVDDGVFHLSTSMCPAHRLQILDRVKDLLNEKKPCYLVSTQLIEAGVDIDFPLVLRELGPLEAVIQAAGRCNREGLLNGADGSPGGRVVVFRSAEGKLPPDRWYHAGRSVVETNFLAAGKLPRIDDPADIREYFTRLYRSGTLDEKHIQDQRQRFAFAQVARDYRLIEDDGVPVVVMTWKEKQDEITALVNQALDNPKRANLRKLTPFQVNLRRYQLDKASGSVGQLKKDLDLFAWTGGYDADFGLDPNNADVFLCP